MLLYWCLIDEVFLASVESYVRSLGRPDLLDLVALPTLQDVNMDDVEDLRPSKRKLIYSEVCPLFKLIITYLRKLRNKSFMSGAFYYRDHACNYLRSFS